MQGIAAICSLAAFVVAWWGLNKLVKKRDWKWWQRHPAGVFAGVVAMFAIAAIVMPSSLPTTASGASDNSTKPAVVAAIPNARSRDLLDGEVPTALKETFSDNAVKVEKGILTVSLTHLTEVFELQYRAHLDQMCMSLWAPDGDSFEKPSKPRWTGVNAFRLVNASGSQGFEFSGGDEECLVLLSLNYDRSTAYVEDRTKPFGELLAADKEAICREELSCWAEKSFITASSLCAAQVERLGSYSHRWTDGMLEAKFSRHRWADKANGLVTYIGDSIEFQNGFGAYQPHVYECDFDPVSGTVRDVRATSGRL